MPSPDARVELVIDESMERTLTWLASRWPENPARVDVARRAVFQGAVLEAVVDESARGADAAEAWQIVTIIRRAMERLDLPDDSLADVRSQLDHAKTAHERELRRARQRALLLGEAPTDISAAHDIVDSIEILDELFP